MTLRRSQVLSKALIPPLLVTLLGFTSVVLSQTKITLHELLTHHTILVHDLQRLSLDVKPGHGPLLFATIDQTKEVQFWIHPGVAAVRGLGKVVLITTGDPSDENHGTIIWPPEKVGLEFGRELEALYRGK